MGRQRPATVFDPRLSAGTLERLDGLHSSTTKHSNVSKELRIGNRSAAGAADSYQAGKLPLISDGFPKW
eukprot:COSAG02_NODE_3183_length_7215_cov_13.727234_4_plen_69_part_00